MSGPTATPDGLAIAVVLVLGLAMAGAAHVWWLSRVASGVLMQPLDFGRELRGRRVFGEHKRLRGLIAMPVAAAASFTLLGGSRVLLPDWLGDGLWSLSAERYALLGFAAGLSFMLAELPNSFLKRQLGLAPGEVPRAGWPRYLCLLLDRVDSVLGVLIVVSLLVPVPLATWAWVLLIGPGMHAVFSSALYRLGIKARAL